MNLTNDSHVILISTKNATERYYQDEASGAPAASRSRDAKS